jgi:hypothetical protein
VKTMTIEALPDILFEGFSCQAKDPIAPRFRVGDSVLVKLAHPEGYTRAPRYVRGRRGTIDRDHGTYVFADTVGRLEGDHPQHVYSVRFAARELWGPQVSERDTLCIDLYDDHLERA